MSESVIRLITEARKRNQERDQLDISHGFSPPIGPELIRCARSALEAAIITEDWPTAAEAFVFIDDYLRGVQ